MFRDFTQDPVKSPAGLKKSRGRLCCTLNCGKPITRYQGPGQENYCRDHQINLAEYGGTGIIGIEHSHARARVCECCGYSPEADPAVIQAAGGDLVILNRLLRSLLTVDHLDGNHSNNNPDNLDTKCLRCHTIKTIVNRDYLQKQVV